MHRSVQAPTQGPCLRFQTHTIHVPAAVTAAAPSSSRGLLHQHQHPACAPSTSYSQAVSPMALPVRHAASGLQCRNAGAKGRHVAVAAGSASIGAAGGDSSRGGSKLSLPERIIAFQQAFWKFLRPHTIRGTILGTTALTTRALLEAPELIDWTLLPKALMGLLALLCGNGFIVGINQIYDVDIDAVNKPFLPIASGELSPGAAWLLCIGLAAGGVSIVARNFGTLITSLYSFGLFLGTIYSVPPLRLKRFAVPAFMIIATVRGFLLNFGVYYATRAALGRGFEWSPAITFITSFVTLFATVIAVTKDLPDVEGDKANGIETFATRIGVQNVSLGAIAVLMANYAGAMWMALQPSLGFNPAVMLTGHLGLAALLALRTWALHSANYNRDAILSFYRWIWTLFYLEYAMFPFI